MNRKGILIVVSGFSGAGKGTLMKALLARYEEYYALSISATTRQPRTGETDGREYFFKTKEEFEKDQETVQDKVTDAGKKTGEFASNQTDKVKSAAGSGVEKVKENTEPRVQ